MCFTPGQSRSQSMESDEDSICIVTVVQPAIGGMQVWSKHPPTGAHKLPTRSSSPQSADTSGQDPLEGLAADQVQPCLLLLHAMLHRLPYFASSASGLMSFHLLKILVNSWKRVGIMACLLHLFVASAVFHVLSMSGSASCETLYTSRRTGTRNSSHTVVLCHLLVLCR